MITNKIGANGWIRKKLKKRAKRGTRKRAREHIEERIREYLGTEYRAIGRPIPSQYAVGRQMSLNKKAYFSEVKFGRKLIAAGLTNFYPNALLLNRFYGDFVFVEDGIVVEIDGSVHEDPAVQERDKRKQYWLSRFGYRVLRVRSSDDEGMDQIIRDLQTTLECKVLSKDSAIRSESFLPPIFRPECQKAAWLKKSQESKVNRPTVRIFTRREDRTAFKNFAKEAQEAGLAKQWLEARRRELELANDSATLKGTE